MNCQQCQRLLLECDDPGTQPLDAAAHLAECLACQAWQKRLLKIESNVPRVPVPPSQAGDKLKRFFLEPAPVPASAPTPAVLPGPRRWHTWIRVAGGLAAAVLLALVGIWLGRLASRLVQPPVAQQQEQPLPEPPALAGSLAAQVLDCDLRLAQTDDPRERLAVLAEIANLLQGETQPLTRAAAAQELAKLAGLYDQVLQKGVVARAADVPRAQRKSALEPVVAKLAQAQKAAETLAVGRDPALAAPLLQIAAVAQKTSGQLHKLMEEATP